MMTHWWKYTVAVAVLAGTGHGVAMSDDSGQPGTKLDRQIARDPQQTLAEGRQPFRFDTFGDETFWGDTLKLHEAIKGTLLGGVGPGVSPRTALAVGLKIDVDALPGNLVSALKHRRVNLDDPTVTVELLRLNAVIGVTGFFDAQRNLSSIGIQCALCHTAVDNSLAQGIGHRLDGWANRDLNVGAIVNLAPDLSAVAALLQVDEATVRKVVTRSEEHTSEL